MVAVRVFAMCLLLTLGVSVAPSTAAPVAPNPALLSPDTSEAVQHAASVVKLIELKRQGKSAVRLFGAAGGDPAMNGLYTFISFYVSPGDGWRVFKVGDFLDVFLISEAPGRATLRVHESTMNATTGVIGSRTRRLVLTWSTAAGDLAPDTVRVTPA